MRKLSDWNKHNIKSSLSIYDALERMNNNGLNFLVISDELGKCVGVITDGDIRRSLIKKNKITLSDNVMTVSNHNFESLVLGNEYKFNFDNKIKFVPILDSTGHLKSIASLEPEKFIIGDVEIGKDKPVFIIAEIGNNHNGNYELAMQMIEKAAYAGADCVKFQMRDLSSLYTISEKTYKAFDLGTEYILDLLYKFQLPVDKILKLFDYCNELSVIPLCTPWDLKSLEILSEYGLSGYKIASADLTNIPLLESVARTNKPVIISTGMSLDNEIKQAVETMDRMLCQYALLHCNSTYPAPYSDINLSYMERLKGFGQTIVGYSGHERGYHIPIAAVALGAKIIEKHFTLDRQMEGVDHKVSLLPNEFELMVKQIRTTEQAMGSREVRNISQGEMINRENLSKSLFYKENVKAGVILKKTDFIIKSPGNGIQPSYINKVIGKELLVDVKSYEKLEWKHVDKLTHIKTRFEYKSNWGFPVRYHDIVNLLKVSNPKILEIHLSYLDLGKKIPSINHDLKEMLVHAPELFANDHILDLSLEKGDYLKKSLKNFEHTIQEAIRISRALNNKKIIKVIFNAGGASDSEFMTDAERKRRYINLINNLHYFQKIEGVELLPQSMPPYPWHFGGQRFHNLFVDPNDIIEFHEMTGIRFCVDLSHTKLACTYLGRDFDSALRKLLPATAHLHIADASGENSEGLQIDEGEINWDSLKYILRGIKSDTTWIPEIWQGHIDNNQEAFKALQKLERVMP